MKHSPKDINREDFMNFFRNDEKLNTLSNDDKIEVFLQILQGSSDITMEILNELICDYQVHNVKISQI